MTNFSSHSVDFQIPEELNYCSEIGLCFLWVYLFFFGTMKASWMEREQDLIL